MPNDFVDLTGDCDDSSSEHHEEKEDEPPVGVDICPDIEDLLDLEGTDDENDNGRNNNDAAVGVAASAAAPAAAQHRAAPEQRIVGNAGMAAEHSVKRSFYIPQKKMAYAQDFTHFSQQKTAPENEGGLTKTKRTRGKRRKGQQDTISSSSTHNPQQPNNVDMPATRGAKKQKAKQQPRSSPGKGTTRGNNSAEKLKKPTKSKSSLKQASSKASKPQEAGQAQDDHGTQQSSKKKRQRKREKRKRTAKDPTKSEGENGATTSLPAAKRPKSNVEQNNSKCTKQTAISATSLARSLPPTDNILRDPVSEAKRRKKNENQSSFSTKNIYKKLTSNSATSVATLPTADWRGPVDQTNRSSSKPTAGLAAVLRVEAWDWLGRSDDHSYTTSTLTGNDIGKLKDLKQPSATKGDSQRVLEQQDGDESTRRTTQPTTEKKKRAYTTKSTAQLDSNAATIAPKMSKQRKLPDNSSTKVRKPSRRKRDPVVVEIPSDSDDDDNEESKQPISRQNEMAQTNDSATSPSKESKAHAPAKEQHVKPSPCRNFIVIEDSSDDDSDGDYTIKFVDTKAKAGCADGNNQMSSTKSTPPSSSSARIHAVNTTQQLPKMPPNSFAKKPMPTKGPKLKNGFGVSNADLHPNSFAKSPRKQSAPTKPRLFQAMPQHHHPDAFCSERDFDYKLSQEAALEMQERLFRDSAARVRSREYQHAPPPINPSLFHPNGSINAPSFLTDPILDIHTRYPSHWQWRNPYARLGLPNGAGLELTKKHYRKLALIYHPDKRKFQDSSARFQAITAAYRKLTS